MFHFNGKFHFQRRCALLITLFCCYCFVIATSIGCRCDYECGTCFVLLLIKMTLSSICCEEIKTSIKKDHTNWLIGGNQVTKFRDFGSNENAQCHIFLRCHKCQQFADWNGSQFEDNNCVLDCCEWVCSFHSYFFEFRSCIQFSWFKRKFISELSCILLVCIMLFVL